jgi:hypothetical protein
VGSTAWALRDVRTPNDADHLRDLGSANTMADGRWTVDPAFKAQRAWYPPLLPATLAIAHNLTGLPVPLLHVRLGLILGILPVLGLVVVAWRWFGPLAAFGAAASACVLAQGTIAGWWSATYTPWLFSATLLIAAVCASLLCLTVALERSSRGWWAASGAIAGLCGLGDLGLTALLGLVILAEAWHTWRMDGWRPAAANLLAWGVPCALIAGIHFGPLVATYGLHVRNSLPSAFRQSYVTERMLWANLNPGLLLAIVGVVALRSEGPSHRKRLLTTWAVASGVLFVYAYLGTRLGLPLLVPDWHYWDQLKAVEAIAAGVGFATLASRRPILGVSIVLAAVALYAPVYLSRWDVTTAVEQAVRRQQSSDAQVVDWLRAHTQPGDVIAADHRLSLTAVLPAGRHVVCLDPYFSHPFVDYAARHAHHDDSGAAYALTRGSQTDRGELVATFGELRVWRRDVHSAQ